MTRDAIPLSPGRLGWKAPAGFLLAGGLMLLGYLFLGGLVAHSTGASDSAPALIPPLLFAIGLLALNLIWIRREQWQPGVIGFDRATRRILQFVLGFAGGAILIVLWAVIMALCGSRWHSAHHFHATGAILVMGLTFLVNFCEELMYRAYLFVWITRWFSSAVAIVGTSVAFFLLHVQSGVPWLSALAGVLTCGILYGVLFARWASLPLVLGFHWANNLAQHALGIRTGPLTLFEPTAPDANVVPAILAGVAAVNLLLAAAIYFWPGDPLSRRQQKP